LIVVGGQSQASPIPSWSLSAWAPHDGSLSDAALLVIRVWFEPSTFIT
jgi:hypothetical protein